MDTDDDAWNSSPAEPPTEGTEPSSGSKLAGRIGQSRVYLLAESSASIHGRLAKRKRDLLDDVELAAKEEEEEETGFLDEDGHTRTNAFMLTGEPISHLTTSKIFAYASQFTEPPMALEWINDTSAVLIYPKSIAARASFDSLLKDSKQLPDDSGLRHAHSVPLELWPPQSRINSVLGQSEPLAGQVSLRWATKDDVKKKGAAKESKFYKMYGDQAGKEGRPLAWSDNREPKRGRREKGNAESTADGMAGRSSLMDRLGPGAHSQRTSSNDERKGNKRNKEAVTKDDLDAELDAFLKETTPEE